MMRIVLDTNVLVSAMLTGGGAPDFALQLVLQGAVTLLADSRKGRRPSYIDAAAPDEAKKLYEAFCDRLETSGRTVRRGVFQAMMDVALVNDGPVTILLDSEERLLRRPRSMSSSQ